MTDIFTLENKIKEIIDELKALCNGEGLNNGAAEEEIITATFLYKFLNDKFMSNLKKFAKKLKVDYKEILKNKNDELDAFYESYPQDVAFGYKDTIEYLINHVSDDDFYKQFEAALVRITKNKRNEAFNIETADGTKFPLFTTFISDYIGEKERNSFAKNIFSAISSERFDFSDAFDSSFDFYSTIFEYLIKDYNKDSGKNGEYFTPQSVSSIIAKILVNMTPIKDTIYEIYDGAAGSGSLILHLANELGNGKYGKKARVFTQDQSAKSTRFLRLNLLLNGMKASLPNVIKGDTLLNPRHFNTPHDQNSGLKKFDYITMNPPFKADFSKTRDKIEDDWSSTDRFFAGIPKIPNEKDKMAIYLMFVQHILYSLKDDGKAAIVVPTGFITAQNGIEKTIRQKLIDEKWFKGCISMPSNIFANTGTNVSVLFIDKSNNDENAEIMLVDASKLGEKRKEGKNQRTVLRPKEIELIENTFINKDVIDDLSVKVSYDQIKEKNCSFSAGQYFDVKIEYVPLTPKEFESKMNSYKENLDVLFNESKSLEKNIKSQIERMNYEQN